MSFLQRSTNDFFLTLANKKKDANKIRNEKGDHSTDTTEM